MNEIPNNDSSPTDAASGKSLPSRERIDDRPATSQAASRNLVAWLALAVAAIALAQVAYQGFTETDDDSTRSMQAAQFDQLRDSLHAIRQATDSNDAKIAELTGDAGGLQGRVQGIETQLEERLQRLELMQTRLGAVEGSMAELRGISSGLRDSWLLAEAEYYMQIANAQLQLADNPKLATLALQLADEKVAQLANPALIGIRRALANELQALAAIESPDIEGIALMLSSLAAAVDSLPLNQDIDVPEAAPVEVDPELTGMDRMFASLKRTASEIVSVRRSDENVRPLIAPEAQYFLRANLTLQFQAARIALLRGEQELYDQSLGDAASWLNRYYDAESAPVHSALQTIDDLRRSISTVAFPDLSESLRLLREYRVMSAANSQPGPADEAATDNGEPQ
ncbi:MAG TPA: uroporphyrinogen-III C-methyltransferase [Woeseiaceae bacterium]|nr:uroporphyrinogen-III C-methyltransferase [Woeseiaceae bacterium]